MTTTTNITDETKEVLEEMQRELPGNPSKTSLLEEAVEQYEEQVSHVYGGN
ncbi:hypothetical protein [Halosimplex halobium]|uniref:hypothetical protein n=1 Tax=Halosimplex halobium TaxID=3396618 RepID=UPI003F5509EF